MTDSPKENSTIQSLQSILEVGAKLAALIATLCVSLSVIFDWGYLTALELTFSEIPTSLTDHTRSAVLWLPFAVAIFPIAVVINLVFDQIESKDVREAKNRGEDISAYINNEKRNSRWSLAILSVIVALLWLAFGDRARPFLFIGVLTAWVLIVIRATPHNHLGTQASMLFRILLVVLPIIPFSLYFSGYNSGRESISPSKQRATITIRGTGSQYQIKANVVRIFERTAILIDENGKILLIKPDDIIQIEKANPISINKGVLCDYWHISCPASTIHVP